MRIAVTSDIHYPTTPESTIRRMVEKLHHRKTDIIVIAGDIAESLLTPDHFATALRFFRESSPNSAVLAVCGNHDLWVRPDSPESSWDLWNGGLKQRAESVGAVWLEGSNFVLDGVAVVGSMMHYDYSARDKTGPVSLLPEDYLITNKAKILNDGVHFRGLPPDKEFARTIGDDFLGRLREAEGDPEVKSIVVVTHVPATEEQMTRRPDDFRWAIATPFFGNLSYESDIKSCKKVRYVVSGHSHHQENALYKRMFLKTLGSDYRKPTFILLDFEQGVPKGTNENAKEEQ